jgi:hypothetical protein
MAEMAKIMIFLGIILVVIGVLMLGIQKWSFSGKLLGDIVIKRDNVTFFFPVATSIVVSIIISLILYLINKFR